MSEYDVKVLFLGKVPSLLAMDRLPQYSEAAAPEYVQIADPNYPNYSQQ